MGLIYPGNLDEIIGFDGGGGIHFTIYDRPTSTTSTLVNEISLYMPQNLENPMNLSWEQVDGLANKLARENAQELVNADLMGQASLVAGYVERAARSFSPTETIVSQGTRKIANPYIAMTFKGIGFRTFEYTFKFTPHTQAESSTIKEIIKEFRKAALPGECSSGVMTFPSEVDIMYLGTGADNGFLNKFKRCIITDVHVNYTSAGFYAAMKDNGFPAETELKIQFSENELVCREDVEEGY